MLMLMLDLYSKQKHQEVHTSERTIVPRTVIFFFDLEAQSDIGWPTTLKIEQICCLELKGAGKL